MRTDHRTDADTLVFLREIDRRKIWALEGYDSILIWCERKGHMSESVAHKRLRAAEHAERYPLALALIRRGELHLSALNKLGKYLTDENHGDVLARARGKTMKELDVLIAELAPQPDVDTTIRPMRSAPAPLGADATSATTAEPAACAAPATPPPMLASAAAAAPVPAPAPARPRASVTPLAPKRFKLEMTLSERGHETLRELEALLSHSGATTAELVERGLEVLLAQAKKQRAAATSQPRESKPRDEETRHVPAAVTREVWERDESQCTFVAADGHRCESRRYLQLHHREPFARGGAATVDNIALLCGVHNRIEGERVYGRAFMESKMSKVVTRTDCHMAVSSPYS